LSTRRVSINQNANNFFKIKRASDSSIKTKDSRINKSYVGHGKGKFAGRYYKGVGPVIIF